MKCLKCGEDLFPRQITCHRCGTMVAIAEMEAKAAKIREDKLKALKKANEAKKKNKEK